MGEIYAALAAVFTPHLRYLKDPAFMKGGDEMNNILKRAELVNDVAKQALTGAVIATTENAAKLVSDAFEIAEAFAKHVDALEAAAAKG